MTDAKEFLREKGYFTNGSDWSESDVIRIVQLALNHNKSYKGD